jgi:hypothetical protein
LIFDLRRDLNLANARLEQIKSGCDDFIREDRGFTHLRDFRWVFPLPQRTDFPVYRRQTHTLPGDPAQRPKLLDGDLTGIKSNLPAHALAQQLAHGGHQRWFLLYNPNPRCLFPGLNRKPPVRYERGSPSRNQQSASFPSEPG